MFTYVSSAVPSVPSKNWTANFLQMLYSRSCNNFVVGDNNSSKAHRDTIPRTGSWTSLAHRCGGGGGGGDGTGC